MLSPIIDGVLNTEDFSHPVKLNDNLTDQIHEGYVTIGEKKRYLKLYHAKIFISKDSKVSVTDF